MGETRIIRVRDYSRDKVPVLIKDELWDGQQYVPAFIHLSGLEQGPALGGCRIHIYGSLSEGEDNVKELAEGMRLKSGLAQVPFGGGKAVMVADNLFGYPDRKQYAPEILRRKRILLGNYADTMVNPLHGDYVTAEDSGTNMADMDFLRERTEYVVGTKVSGDPSPFTAYGVYQGLMACLKLKGRDSVEGLTLAVKGAGNVAEHLVFGFKKGDTRFGAEARQAFPGLLHLKPKVILYTDKKMQNITRFKTKARGLGLGNLLKRRFLDEIYETPSGTDKINVFIPAAARHSASGEYITRLANAGCEIIAGCENNQFKNPEEDMKRVQDAGMIYAPDFANNAGGLINVAEEWAARKEGRDYDPQKALKNTQKIGQTIEEILVESARSGRSTLDLAKTLAEERIARRAA